MARILLVEDQDDIREIQAMILRDEGHLVDEATDGDAAFAAHDANTYDAAVLDCMVPGERWDVVTFVGMLRSKGCKGIALCSAKSDLEEMAAKTNTLAIRKPFGLSEFIEAVNSLLRT